jgi:hypothetical protein
MKLRPSHHRQARTRPLVRTVPTIRPPYGRPAGAGHRALRAAGCAPLAARGPALTRRSMYNASIIRALWRRLACLRSAP